MIPQCKTDPALLQRLKDVVRNASPMTRVERFEQEVSWVYSCMSDKTITKDQVRKILLERQGA